MFTSKEIIMDVQFIAWRKMIVVLVIGYWYARQKYEDRHATGAITFHECTVIIVLRETDTVVNGQSLALTEDIFMIFFIIFIAILLSQYDEMCLILCCATNTLSGCEDRPA